MKKCQMTQHALIQEFFEANPYRDIPHAEAVDWLVAEYKKRTKKVFRDPDRGIRKLAQSGFLIKIKKGVYRYDPILKTQRNLEDFTESQKEEIKKRDQYRCVIRRKRWS